MSASRESLRWGRWVTLVVVVIGLANWTYANTQAPSGTLADFPWVEFGTFLGTVVLTLGSPYMVNRATFKK